MCVMIIVVCAQDQVSESQLNWSYRTSAPAAYFPWGQSPLNPLLLGTTAKAIFFSPDLCSWAIV